MDLEKEGEAGWGKKPWSLESKGCFLWHRRRETGQFRWELPRSMESGRERKEGERLQTPELSITYIFGFGQCHQEMFPHVVTPGKCLHSLFSITDFDGLHTCPQALCVLHRLCVCIRSSSNLGENRLLKRHEYVLCKNVHKHTCMCIHAHKKGEKKREGGREAGIVGGPAGAHLRPQVQLHPPIFHGSSGSPTQLPPFTQPYSMLCRLF